VAGRRRTVPLEHTGGFCASVRASLRAVNPHSRRLDFHGEEVDTELGIRNLVIGIEAVFAR
jgi:hypothetical protein